MASTQIEHTQACFRSAISPIGRASIAETFRTFDWGTRNPIAAVKQAILGHHDRIRDQVQCARVGETLPGETPRKSCLDYTDPAFRRSLVLGLIVAVWALATCRRPKDGSLS